MVSKFTGWGWRPSVRVASVFVGKGFDEVLKVSMSVQCRRRWIKVKQTSITDRSIRLLLVLS